MRLHEHKDQFQDIPICFLPIKVRFHEKDKFDNLVLEYVEKIKETADLFGIKQILTRNWYNFRHRVRRFSENKCIAFTGLLDITNFPFQQ